MSFGIICDRCGEICRSNGKIKGYEMQIDSIDYLDGSRENVVRDNHLCNECHSDFQIFMSKPERKIK